MYAAQYNLGEATLQLKEFSQAVDSFEKAIALKPESALTWEGLGLTHYYQDHFRLAVDAFERARRLAPDSAKFNNNLGFTCLFVERWDDAVSSFKTTLDLDQNFDTARLGLCAAYSLARRAEAIMVCLNILNLAPASAAESALREAISRDPDHSLNHFNLGIVCLQRKERDCAFGEYTL